MEKIFDALYAFGFVILWFALSIFMLLLTTEMYKILVRKLLPHIVKKLRLEESLVFLQSMIKKD